MAVLVFFYTDTSKPKFKPKIAPSWIDSNDSYQVWDSTFGENFGIDSGLGGGPSSPDLGPF